MNIFVEEIGTTPHSTASQMFVDNKPFGFVIEDGYRERKIPGETRIPAGRYRIMPRFIGGFYVRYKARFGHKFSLHVTDVPEFTDVLIHIGNTVKDTRGCLLVNAGIQLDRNGTYYGIDSTTPYKLLYNLVALAFERGEEVWIEIHRRPVVDENTPVG